MLSRYVVSQVKHNSYFLVGLALGLWVALAMVPLEEDMEACMAESVSAEPFPDDFEPHREEKPLRSAGQSGRSVQRPRYYSTELGIRGRLLAGALSSESALETRAAALNKTASQLQPALRFFITASALQAAPGKANVVGFTDTREMLKPFHALKYLADNYLEEYDFFFLVSDTSYVNARRLNELVSRISVSQDVYMGTMAEDDTHYCTLEGGILLSNSVLRAVHGELDWCVRNSYSAHHHENLGRCVLHAKHLPCTERLQGEEYVSVRLADGAGGAGGAGGLTPALAGAVTAAPLALPEHFYQIHAYVSRVHLENVRSEIRSARGAAARSSRRHPRGFRNATWPPALRRDAGLASPPPTRFDHPRWTRFNGSHAFLPDELRAAAPLAAAQRRARDMILEESVAWAKHRWGASEARLVEGAWCWEPPYALRYRLLLALRGVGEGAGASAGGAARGAGALRQLEAVRPLGAARLAPARYVTETGRVTLLLPVPHADASLALGFLRRYESTCVQRDANTALVVVLVRRGAAADGADAAALRDAVRALALKHRAELREESAGEADGSRGEAEGSSAEARWDEAARVAMWQAAARLAKDTLILLLPPDAEFTEDFLNRVRMNTIAGEQWFLASGFARFAHFAHPHFVEPDGSRPARGTGRFAPRAAALAVHRADLTLAREMWLSAGGAAGAAPADLMRPPPAAPCAPAAGAPGRGAGGAAPERLACLQRERDANFSRLNLGARHTLAKLLLHSQAMLA
ncbi:chondroitin sulfate synthase 2 [Zerene cesonia]|uniref:chondroitin sulfate synthase 2 n=1 Tax=Zerene cesonia TaxID=33412 RepID=UPI0018E54BDB|nr:chondroitin sulfate synthase 2 [Zerene cesonia]